MAARVLGRFGTSIGRPVLATRSLASIGRAHTSRLPSLQRVLFDKRSHARVHKALYHASAPVLKKVYTAEMSPAPARVPTVPGVHPNSGGYELPHNPPDRPVMSTAVYITGCSVEDKPNELFPDPGTNWYRTLNSLTGLKGIARQNYLAGYFRHAWGYHKDAGMVGIARNRSPYIWPCAMWAAVIIVSKELMVIDAEWLAVPFYWFTWWTVVTFIHELRPMIPGVPKAEAQAARREKLRSTMYTVKELIQTHHDFIAFVRGLPAMAYELADLIESKQTAERNTKHFQIKQFVEAFLEARLRQQQSALAARQLRFEQEGPEYVAKLLQDPSVKDRILDSTIEMVTSGGKQKINPVKAAYMSYIKNVRKIAQEEAKAAEAARPAIERAVAKSRAIRADRRHQIALKLKADGGPDLTPFSPPVKVEPLTEAEEAIIAQNRAANAEQRNQWFLRLQALIPVRQHAAKS